MNKRGFLLGEETLKIIIAVICIGFLIYVLASLYYSGFGDKDIKLAKASLEYLVREINAGATEIEIYNPEKWYVLNYMGNLCICEKIDKCEPDETCIESDVVVLGEIKIENPPVILEINDNVLSLK